MSFKENEYYAEIFKNIDISQNLLSNKEFDSCTFDNCIFNESILENCRFIDCIFNECDLSLLKIKGSVFNDITIKNSKAIGIDWSLLSIHFPVKFHNSNISMSSFFRLDLKNCEIISCKAHDVDFGETNLEKVSFKDTDLLNAIFGNTNLKNTDLSKARNYMINPEQNRLNNTKVSLPEAESFLKFLNIKIMN